MIIAKDLRPAIKIWFGSLEPQLFVTHNFGFCVSPETGGLAIWNQTRSSPYPLGRTKLG